MGSSYLGEWVSPCRHFTEGDLVCFKDAEFTVVTHLGPNSTLFGDVCSEHLGDGVQRAIEVSRRETRFDAAEIWWEIRQFQRHPA